MLAPDLVASFFAKFRLLLALIRSAGNSVRLKFGMRRMAQRLCLILVALAFFLGGRGKIEFVPTATALIAQFHDCVETGQGNHQAPTDKSKHSGACSFCQCCASLDIEPPPLIAALTFPTPVAARAGGGLA